MRTNIFERERETMCIFFFKFSTDSFLVLCFKFPTFPPNNRQDIWHYLGSFIFLQCLDTMSNWVSLFNSYFNLMLHIIKLKSVLFTWGKGGPNTLCRTHIAYIRGKFRFQHILFNSFSTHVYLQEKKCSSSPLFSHI